MSALSLLRVAGLPGATKSWGQRIDSLRLQIVSAIPSASSDHGAPQHLLPLAIILLVYTASPISVRKHAVMDAFTLKFIEFRVSSVETARIIVKEKPWVVSKHHGILEYIMLKIHLLDINDQYFSRHNQYLLMLYTFPRRYLGLSLYKPSARRSFSCIRSSYNEDSEAVKVPWGKGSEETKKRSNSNKCVNSASARIPGFGVWSVPTLTQLRAKKDFS
ncbi:hypothetical protein EDB19DRAFT_2029220 [Suillus lakei]|nr:hypothetical protein EDB19DRAFT_2029220 [Suillus lakei]